MLVGIWVFGHKWLGKNASEIGLRADLNALEIGLRADLNASKIGLCADLKENECMFSTVSALEGV